MLFGNRIRELRDKQGVLQRQLAALLEIDTPMFSKIERGDRRAKREHVIKLAEYLHQDVKEMLTLWLADKVLDAVGAEEEISYDAITVAQKHVQSSRGRKINCVMRCFSFKLIGRGSASAKGVHQHSRRA